MPFFRYLAERQIQEAQEHGTLKQPASYQGQPVDNSAYFNAPADQRLAFHVLKIHDQVPPAVALNQEIQQLKGQLNDCTDPAKQASLKAAMAEKRNAYRMALENHNR